MINNHILLICMISWQYVTERQRHCKNITRILCWEAERSMIHEMRLCSLIWSCLEIKIVVIDGWGKYPWKWKHQCWNINQGEEVGPRLVQDCKWSWIKHPLFVIILCKTKHEFVILVKWQRDKILGLITPLDFAPHTPLKFAQWLRNYPSMR